MIVSDTTSHTDDSRGIIYNHKMFIIQVTGKPYKRGRLSKYIWPLRTNKFRSADFDIDNIIYKTSLLNEEVNCIKLSPSGSVPCRNTSLLSLFSSFYPVQETNTWQAIDTSTGNLVISYCVTVIGITSLTDPQCFNKKPHTCNLAQFYGSNLQTFVIS